MAQVEQLTDKLKFIGHLVDAFLGALSVRQVNDKLKRIGHQLSVSDIT